MIAEINGRKCVDYIGGAAMVVADKSYEKVREERSVTDPVQIRSSK